MVVPLRPRTWPALSVSEYCKVVDLDQLMIDVVVCVEQPLSTMRYASIKQILLRESLTIEDPLF